jgi:hypothetical protein
VKHCGSCNHACADHRLCCDGQCVPANDDTAECPATDSTTGCSTCQPGEECCEGRCVETLGSDINHCGGCGVVCDDGQLPGCCGGKCVDLASDTSCGTCDNKCGILKLGGGVLCHCELISSVASCVGGPVGEVLQVCY